MVDLFPFSSVDCFDDVVIIGTVLTKLVFNTLQSISGAGEVENKDWGSDDVGRGCHFSV